MIFGIYNSASSLDTLSRMQEVVANNLANMTTNGFKQELTQVLRTEPGRLDLTGQLDMQPGAIKMSEEPTHMTIAGDGLFTVQTEQGLAFTRNGDFKINQAGKLVTQDNYPVMGQRGEIIIGSESFSVNEQGQIFVGHDMIDQLALYQPTGSMQRIGHTLMQSFAPEDMVALDNSQVQIIQGALEGSNVNPVESMVQMMTIVRNYEANQKLLTAQDESTRSLISQVGKVV